MTKTIEVPRGAKVAKGFNGHVDADECACAGPFHLTGLSLRENFGVVVAESEDDAVMEAQERHPGVFHAIALNPASLR